MSDINRREFLSKGAGFLALGFIPYGQLPEIYFKDSAEYMRKVILPLGLAPNDVNEQAGQLGKGFNPLTWEFLPTEAVKYQISPSEAHRETVGYTKAFESQKELKTLVTQSLGGGYNWGTGNASGSLQMINEAKVSEHTIAIAAIIRVLTTEVRMVGPSFKDKDTRRLFKDDPRLFFTRYGDRFCSRIVRGGALIATAEFYSRSASERDVVKAHIEAKGTFYGGTGEAFADYSKTVEKLDQYAHSTISLWKTGVITRFPTFKQLADDISNFPTDVERSGGDSLIFGFSNYSVADGFDPKTMILPDLHPIIVRLQEFEEASYRMNEIQTRIENIKRYPKQYLPAPPDLDKYSQAAAAYNKEILDGAAKLAQNPFAAQLPSIPEIHELKIGPLPVMRPKYEPDLQIITTDTAGQTVHVTKGEWTRRTYNHDYNSLRATILDIDNNDLKIKYRVGKLDMTGDGRRFFESGWVDGSAPPSPLFDWPTSLAMKLEGPLADAYDIEYDVQMNQGSVSHGTNGSWAGMHGPAENKYSWAAVRIIVRSKK